MIDGYWLSTAILLAMTIGVIYFRYASTQVESNWPLVYYFFAVLHMQLFPDGLAREVVFAAVIAAMFIRFEFLAGFFLKSIQVLEYVFLLMIGYRLFQLLR
jgi:hypothetical protein